MENKSAKCHLKEKLIISKKNFISFNEDKSINDDYLIKEMVGAGSFGTIRKGFHKKTQQYRAIKIFKKCDHDESKLYLEVDILSKLSHPNILQIYESYEDITNFYMVSELCSGGELFDKIIENRCFNENDSKQIMHQILSAVCYAHKNNVIHRDLKPENILLDDKSDNPIIKIIDWGEARYYNKKRKLSELIGTPYYIAPEVIAGKYDEKCDVWSCGVIMFILLSGSPPFIGRDNSEILKSIKTGRFVFKKSDWKNISKEAIDLISKMIKYCSKERLSAAQCLEHPWFKNMETLKFGFNDVNNQYVSSFALKNIKAFTANRKFQHGIISYIVNQLISKDDRNMLYSQFKSWDTNGDGLISRDEIYEAYKNIFGVIKANEDVDIIFKSCDLDCNGYLDYNEFLAATMSKSKLMSQKNLELAFSAIDADQNGKISKDEIMSIFDHTSVIDNAKLTEIINEVDKNRDGAISLEEFKNFMFKFF